MSTESFPLFGLNLQGLRTSFFEKLNLLLAIRDTYIRHPAPSKPARNSRYLSQTVVVESATHLIGVGGTPDSVYSAGVLGLPLMVAVIGGETRNARPLRIPMS